MPGEPPSEFMRAALEEAEAALGWSSPNPAVGAVVVRDGQIVARGRTAPIGGPHAEAVALREAGEAADGATLYSTLEPCSHHGRTPPCTDAIIDAGIAEVRFALDDPDPRVDGDGGQRLRDAGVRVESGDGEAEAARQLSGYLKHRRTGLPEVVVKFATSLDGRIAAASGDSRWVTGTEAREWVHRLRSRVDAIAVGSGTVLADDPELTARPGGSTTGVHQPLRVVLDTRGRTSPGARVLHTPPPTLVATGDSSPTEWQRSIVAAGAELLSFPSVGGRVDVDALLRHLGERGVLTLLVEGGGTLLGTLFDRRMVDHVYAVIAPVVVGAASAPAAVTGEGAQRMHDVPRLHDVEVTRLGEDTLIAGKPSWPELQPDREARAAATEKG